MINKKLLENYAKFQFFWGITLISGVYIFINLMNRIIEIRTENTIYIMLVFFSLGILGMTLIIFKKRWETKTNENTE